MRRESLRAETERARAEEYKGRLETRDKEIAQVREQLQKMLQAAEGQLAAAAAKIAEVSKPPPPNPQARELDDARIRAARLQAELAELRAEFDEMRRELDTARIEADGARTALGALQASLTVRDARADDALAALAAANERAEAAAKEAAAARAEQDRLVKSEEESRALAFGAQERFGDHVSAARSQPYYLDVTHPRANKGEVVKYLSTRYDIPEEGIISASPTYGGALPRLVANHLQKVDATNLATELYNSNQAAASRDHFGTGNKYIVPTVVNGKVYVGTTNGVGAFGLLCSYAIAPHGVTVPANGVTQTVNVVASTGCPWTASGNQSWLRA